MLVPALRMLLRLLHRNSRLEPFLLLPDNHKENIMAKHIRIGKVEHVGKKATHKKATRKGGHKKSTLKK